MAIRINHRVKRVQDRYNLSVLGVLLGNFELPTTPHYQ